MVRFGSHSFIAPWVCAPNQKPPTGSREGAGETSEIPNSHCSALFECNLSATIEYVLLAIYLKIFSQKAGFKNTVEPLQAHTLLAA